MVRHVVQQVLLLPQLVDIVRIAAMGQQQRGRTKTGKVHAHPNAVHRSGDVKGNQPGDQRGVAEPEHAGAG